MNDLVLKNKILFKIDKRIDDLVKKIELLNYVNPINIEEEKIKFFNSKYSKEPSFLYPTRDFDKFNLHKEFFALPIHEIEDDRLRDFYEEIIYFYSGLIQCIETIGKGKRFYFNSLHSFGTPTEKDVKNAKFILHFESENKRREMFRLKYSAEDSKAFFKAYSERYDFTYEIKTSDKMGAIAMVSNSAKALVLNSTHTFSENQLHILTNHEIGVHMVTSMNGVLHPLQVFSHGFPNNEETQEGLAVFSEYMSGNLTVRRLKELAYRVLAVDSLAKGYTFSKTFRMLYNDYELNKNEAFHIAVRAHRGGGLTKDHLYLTGLQKIYNRYKTGKDLHLLLTGKVSLEHYDNIKYMIDKGYALQPRHITDSLAQNKNTNKTVDFILENLK